MCFVERLRAQAVRTRQIEDDDPQMGRRPSKRAFLAFDRDAGVIAHLGPQPGQRVEEGGLPAVRVAGQHDEHPAC